MRCRRMEVSPLSLPHGRTHPQDQHPVLREEVTKKCDAKDASEGGVGGDGDWWGQLGLTLAISWDAMSHERRKEVP